MKEPQIPVPPYLKIIYIAFAVVVLALFLLFRPLPVWADATILAIGGILMGRIVYYAFRQGCNAYAWSRIAIYLLAVAMLILYAILLESA